MNKYQFLLSLGRIAATPGSEALYAAEEAFEGWLQKRYSQMSLAQDSEGEYLENSTRLMWESWHASRLAADRTARVR